MKRIKDSDYVQRCYTIRIMILWMYCLFINRVDASKQQMHDVHDKMTKRELRHIFDVENTKEVPLYDLIDTNRFKWSSDLDETYIIKPRLVLDMFNERFDIILSPHKGLVSPELVSIIRNGSNSRLFHGLPKSSECHYQGIAVSHNNASVAFSNCTHMRGSIMLVDHLLILHPMPKRFRLSNNSQTHVVFKRAPALAPNKASMGFKVRDKRLSSIDSVIEDTAAAQTINDRSVDEEFCDVKNLDNKTLPFFALRDSEGASGFGYGPITLELALFMDGQLYQHFVEEYGVDRAEEELVDFSLALINNVYQLYQQPSMQPKLNVVIVRFELWKTQPEEIEGSKHKNGEAQLFLDNFCTYQAQLNPANRAFKAGRWDHATLLTGFDIYHTTSSVAGVAPVARMCDPVFSCSLVEGLHLGRSYVLAHEMGHNLGMVHDGVQNQCSRNCCLMSAINGAGKTTWSPCSVRELNAYILSLGNPGSAPNCLADGVNAVEIKDHKLKGLPGQRFTADQQCSFFWGRDFRNEIPAGKRKSEICNILWCGNGGSTISTSHPALEGTWCGPNKWCINGQCQAWTKGSTPPAPIDGAWSPWTTTSKSSCSECKVSAGVRVRKDVRGCDNPAPNNGGKECKGSPIRGILCEPQPAKCGNIEKQKYSDDVCASLKDNGTCKGDVELSGKSFLHTTSPCKIWCHLGDTKLIRNKGFYPDGTPCGIEKYCVDGECLELSCNRKAVVFENPSDCPNATASVDGWSAWSNWSNCSTTCGQGQRSRKRHCHNDKTASCLGVSLEEQDCPGLSPCSTFTQWSAWGDCSVSCGYGIRIRSRDCKNGAECAGDTIQFDKCNNTACSLTNAWSEWTAWSVCTKTCGADGQRSRRRNCRAGDQCSGKSQETEQCPKKDCPDQQTAGLFSWTSWGPCSATCGTGTQTRSRPCRFNTDSFILVERCVDGQAIDDRECSEQPCSNHLGKDNWSEWSSFGPCSVTCGAGIQSRSRTCQSKSSTCQGGINRDEKPCFDSPCQTEAIRTTTALLHTTTDFSVDGWSSWAAWSSCSRTCGVEWTSWTTWSPCSRTCGSDGQRTRTRRCLALELDECSGPDKEASPCEAVLPSCNSGSSRASVIASLQGSDLFPQWSSWSAWSPCSCFNDKSLRRRYCQIIQPNVLGFCVGPVLDERHCTPSNCTPVPGGWSTWSEWSACSIDCVSASTNAEGYRIRHRQCSEPFPINRGPYCFGQSFEKVACSSLPTCSGTPVDGGWSDWSSWSSCSTSCGTGHRSRTRYCTNPSATNNGRPCQGLDFNLEVCQRIDSCRSTVDGSWGRWSNWSPCSQSCGFAFQSRQRICDSPEPSSSRACTGLSYMTRLCTLAQCPNSINGGWSAWLNWSECSVQCGIGIRSRSRNCDNPHPMNGGFPCLGASSDIVLCTGQQKNCDTMDSKIENFEILSRAWENNN